LSENTDKVGGDFCQLPASNETPGYTSGGVWALGYDLGGYVPHRFPNQDPVLKRICIQNDT